MTEIPENTEGGVRFYSFIIGKWVSYNDETGKVRKVTDYDQDYPFSYQDLIKKIKKEYKVDLEKDYKELYKERDIDVSRGKNDELPYPIYYLKFKLSKKEQKHFVFDKELDKYWRQESPTVTSSFDMTRDPYWAIFINANTGETILAKQVYIMTDTSRYLDEKVLKKNGNKNGN